MSETLIPHRSIIDIFEARAIEFQKVNPVESRKLAGNLLEWASAIPIEGTIGDIVASQISFILENGRKTEPTLTAEQVVEGLFSPNPKGEIDADIIMGRLQLG